MPFFHRLTQRRNATFFFPSSIQTSILRSASQTTAPGRRKARAVFSFQSFCLYKVHSRGFGGSGPASSIPWSGWRHLSSVFWPREIACRTWPPISAAGTNQRSSVKEELIVRQKKCERLSFYCSGSTALSSHRSYSGEVGWAWNAVAFGSGAGSPSSNNPGSLV